ncbi:ARL2_Bind_BART domain-containing protein [Chloropicon roscoffensis]|uniref:Cilia- and flagella-associated protein 36 n=1 Tax=Chloropicon roscoffensis TaxID=1461544 RepID=A0AAX4PFF5_9CHLO
MASIIQDVAEFLFEDEEFGSSLENFAKDNCSVFTEGEEHKLEYTELYQKYQGLFEEKLESFLKTKNCNSDEFMKACQEAAEKGEEEDDNAAFLTFLLALVDYGTFVQMMKETAGVE